MLQVNDMMRKEKKEDLLLKGNGFTFHVRIDSYKFAPCENGYLYIQDK